MSTDPPVRRSLEAWLVGIGLVLPTLAAWAYFHQWAGTTAMMPIYSAGKVVQFGLPIVWALACARCWPRGVLAPHGLGPALAFGVSTGAAIVLGYWFWMAELPIGQSAAERMTDRMAQAGFADPRWFLAMAVFYSVAHSGLEEYYWRGFIFARLEARMAAPAAILVASLGFAAHHALILAAFFPGDVAWVTLTTAGVGVGGAVWCWLYRRSGSLLGPWLSHALVDAALMTVGYLMLSSRAG